MDINARASSSPSLHATESSPQQQTLIMDGRDDRTSSAGYRTGDATEAWEPRQTDAMGKVVREEPRKRKQCFASIGGPREKVHSSLHHASDWQQSNDAIFPLPTVITTQLNSEPAPTKEAKGKEKASRCLKEDDQRAFSSTAVETVPPERNLYFLVRDLEDGNKYHRAIYLHERSLSALVHGILEKFHGGSGIIAMLSFDNAAGVRVVIDDDVMLQLPNGKDLIVEFQRADPNDTLVPVSELRNPVSTTGATQHGEHTQSTQIHSRDQSASTETFLGSFLSTAASEVTCTTPDIAEYIRSKVSPSSRSADQWSEPAAILNSIPAANIAENAWLDFPDLPQWTPKFESAWESSPNLSLELSTNTAAETDSMVKVESFETSAKDPPTSAPGSSASPIIKLEHKQDSTPPRRPLPLAKEAKKAELLEKNRMAASKCRGRRKMAETRLKDELREKTQENYVLQETLKHLQGQADTLNMMVADHGACMDHERYSTVSNPSAAFERADGSTNEYQAEFSTSFDEDWHDLHNHSSSGP